MVVKKGGVLQVHEFELYKLLQFDVFEDSLLGIDCSLEGFWIQLKLAKLPTGISVS